MHNKLYKIEQELHISEDLLKPMEIYSGLSYYEIAYLVHKPLEENCPIQLQDVIEPQVLDQIPFFRICEDFLNIIKNSNHIKLTPLGALTKKILVALYEPKYYEDWAIEAGIIKLHREQDSCIIQSARITCEIAKLVKKREGKLSLTKNGEKLLQDRTALFKHILTTFSFQFNWAFNDGHTHFPMPQTGNLYSIYCLLKYGNQALDTKFYSKKYQTIVEYFIRFGKDEYNMEINTDFSNCYELRMFYRFTDWFGFTQTTRQKYDGINQTKATNLLKLVYKLQQ